MSRVVATIHATDHNGEAVEIDVWSDGDVAFTHTGTATTVVVASEHMKALGTAARYAFELGESC